MVQYSALHNTYVGRHRQLKWHRRVINWLTRKEENHWRGFWSFTGAVGMLVWLLCFFVI